MDPSPPVLPPWLSGNTWQPPTPTDQSINGLNPMAMPTAMLPGFEEAFQDSMKAHMSPGAATTPWGSAMNSPSSIQIPLQVPETAQLQNAQFTPQQLVNAQLMLQLQTQIALTQFPPQAELLSNPMLSQMFLNVMANGVDTSALTSFASQNQAQPDAKQHPNTVAPQQQTIQPQHQQSRHQQQQHHQQHHANPYQLSNQRQNQSAQNAAPQDGSDNRGRQVCLNFLRGNCTRSSATCKFWHPTLDPNIPPNACKVFYYTSACQYGTHCRDQHLLGPTSSSGGTPDTAKMRAKSNGQTRHDGKPYAGQERVVPGAKHGRANEKHDDFGKRLTPGSHNAPNKPSDSAPPDFQQVQAQLALPTNPPPPAPQPTTQPTAQTAPAQMEGKKGKEGEGKKEDEDMTLEAAREILQTAVKPREYLKIHEAVCNELQSVLPRYVFLVDVENLNSAVKSILEPLVSYYSSSDVKPKGILTELREHFDWDGERFRRDMTPEEITRLMEVAASVTTQGVDRTMLKKAIKVATLEGGATRLVVFPRFIFVIFRNEFHEHKRNPNYKPMISAKFLARQLCIMNNNAHKKQPLDDGEMTVKGSIQLLDSMSRQKDEATIALWKAMKHWNFFGGLEYFAEMHHLQLRWLDIKKRLTDGTWEGGWKPGWDTDEGRPESHSSVVDREREDSLIFTPYRSDDAPLRSPAPRQCGVYEHATATPAGAPYGFTHPYH